MRNEVLRIAVVLGEMGTGGIERVVMNYYRHLDHSRVQFDIYAHKDSAQLPTEEVSHLGGQLILIPTYSHVFEYIKVLVQHFRENQYSIVHVHLNTMSLFAQCAAWRASIPVRITHSHSTAGKREFKRNALKYALRLFANTFPTLRCACTQYAGEWLFGKRHSKDIKVWKNTIDIDAYAYNDKSRHDIRQSYDVQDDEILLGHVGRFMPQKNHDFLIDVFSEYRKMEPKAKLMLVGDGKDVEKVREKVSKLGLSDSVIFTGSFDEVGSFYSAFDAFVLPSLYEGLGMVVIEAQVSGLPIIVSDVVPDDAVITPCVMKKSLADSPEDWAKTIQAQRKSVKRTNQEEEIRNAGYDVERVAIEMTEWYLALNRKIEDPLAQCGGGYFRLIYISPTIYIQITLRSATAAVHEREAA